MARDDNAAIARTFFEAWNDRDFDRGVAIAADDAEIVEVPTDERFQGPDGIRGEYDKWATGLPDGKVEIRNVIASDDYAVSECTVRGTNTGPFASPMGEMPPTGRAIEFPFCSVMEIRDGKLRRLHHYYDVATMMRQLGLMPEAPAGVAT
jgi:steroid delta-isomerase-like uncharacterized protein